MRRALREESPGRFAVDLRALGGRRWHWLWPTRTRVDGYCLGRAVLAVLARCPDRDPRGRPMCWNEVRILLSAADFEPLRPLIDRLKADLVELMQEHLDRSAAVALGPPAVQLAAAAGAEQSPGRATIAVRYVLGAKPSVADAGATVRVGRYTSGGGAPTVRVGEPDAAEVSGLLLAWSGGTARVPLGRRVVVGRAHPGAVGAVVPLVGVDGRVNKRQLFVEADGEGALIGRLPAANPVHVEGRLLQPGGQLRVERLPLCIDLSCGAVELQLDRIEVSA